MFAVHKDSLLREADQAIVADGRGQMDVRRGEKCREVDI